MALVLIGGGVRSGKSRYALTRARACGGKLAYIATAQALDEEMAQRIAHHRAERADEFTTIEEPIDIARAIREADADAIVVDCLTLWLANTPDPPVAAAIEATRGKQVFVVTNEVGCGIVPVTTSGREFRDRAGIVNQRFADAADEVYFMVFGQPLRIK